MPDQFRFWGKVDPRGRQKPPILAAIPDADLDGTVAKLRIYDPIDSWGEYWGVSAKEILQALDSLPSNVTDLHLHLNSPGGEVYEGIAIVNALRAHPARVTAVVDGLAASAASFIAAAADELVMGQNTELMIHDAWGICMGPAEDMQKMSDRLNGISDNIASIYQVKAGGTVEGWRASMLAETWYSAEEAVSSGLADRVAGDDDQGDGARNGFDLSVFKHRGRSEAPDPASTHARIGDEGSAERAARYRKQREREKALAAGMSLSEIRKLEERPAA